jgi:hypothetical protein
MWHLLAFYLNWIDKKHLEGKWPAIEVLGEFLRILEFFLHDYVGNTDDLQWLLGTVGTTADTSRVNFQECLDYIHL